MTIDVVLAAVEWINVCSVIARQTPCGLNQTIGRTFVAVRTLFACTASELVLIGARDALAWGVSSGIADVRALGGFDRFHRSRNTVVAKWTRPSALVIGFTSGTVEPDGTKAWSRGNSQVRLRNRCSGETIYTRAADFWFVYRINIRKGSSVKTEPKQ